MGVPPFFCAQERCKCFLSKFGKRRSFAIFIKVSTLNKDFVSFDSVVLRPLQGSDLAPLEKIIRETWTFDEISSLQTARRLARADLSSCLLEQSFTRVAEVAGRPVGVIMGKKLPHWYRPLRWLLRYAASQLLLRATQDGRRVARLFSDIEVIDQRLLAQAGRAYQGELSFFIVDGSCRGLGVGRALYASLMEYFAREDIRSAYLFTDTDCNFSFYERRGWKKRGAHTEHYCFACKHSSTTYFLFEQDFASV